MNIKLLSHWDIEAVGKMQQDFLSAVDLNEPIEVDFEEVVQISTLGLQVFLSFLKTCKERDIKISYVNFHDDIGNFLEKLNLLDKIGYQNG